jgi:DNA (cytosine-5)-methyltransferase 1
MKTHIFKERGGKAGGGKGYLGADELSFTLPTFSDQYVLQFIPMEENKQEEQPIILMDQGGAVMNVNTEGTVGTLRKETHGHEPIICYGILGNIIGRDHHNGGQGFGISEEESGTLTKTDRHGVATICFDPQQITSPQNRSNPQEGDPSPSLTTSPNAPILIEKVYTDIPGRGFRQSDGVTPTLEKGMGTGGGKVPFIQQQCYPINTMIIDRKNPDGGPGGFGIGENNSPQYTILKYHEQACAYTDQTYRVLIRRLTPVECLRLQGFPDNHCDIPSATDAKIYQATGNSMTVQVMNWIGTRINMVHELMHQR